MTEPQLEQLAALSTRKPWAAVVIVAAILTANGGVVAGAALGSWFHGVIGQVLSILAFAMLYSLWRDWRLLLLLIGVFTGAVVAWLAVLGVEVMGLVDRVSDVVAICVLVVGAIAGGIIGVLARAKISPAVKTVVGCLICGVCFIVIGGTIGGSVGGSIGGGLVGAFGGVMIGRAAVRRCYKKECTRAVASYSEQLRLDPRSVEAYVNRGNAYIFSEKYDEAIADFTEATRLEPDSAVSYCNRGVAYSQKQEYADAMADYTESIRIDPALALAYYHRGSLHHQRGEHENAVADLTEFLRLEPQNRAAHQMLAASHRALGEEITHDQDQKVQGTEERRPDGRSSGSRTRAIVAAVFVVLLLAWGAWQSYHEKASKACYEQRLEALHKYDYPSAIRHFSNAIQHDQGFVDAYYHRGIAHNCTHDYDAAVADFTEMIKLEPRNGVAYDLRALAHRSKRNYGLAEADYCEAIRLGCISHQNRGDLYMDMKKYRQAVADYTRAIVHRPDASTGYTKRSAAYRALGEEELAAADEHKAKEMTRRLVDEIMKSNH